MPRYAQTGLLRLISLVLIALLSHSNMADDKVVLQLKWKHQFQFAGYYAAQYKGYFKEEGLEVDIREIDPNIPPPRKRFKR